MERQARSTQVRAAPIALDALVLGFSALAVLAGFACAPETRRALPPGSGPILVGEFHSLTGPFATSGRALHDGFLLAIEEQNARGGVHGRPVEVKTLDDRGRADEVRIAVRRLLDEDEAVLLAGGTTPDFVEEAAEEADGAAYVAPFGDGLIGSERGAPRLGAAGELEPRGELDLAFVASWRARHEGSTPTVDAAVGYDAGRFVCAALERAATFDRDDVWDALLAVRGLEGARGLALGARDEDRRAFEHARKVPAETVRPAAQPR